MESVPNETTIGGGGRVVNLTTTEDFNSTISPDYEDIDKWVWYYRNVWHVNSVPAPAFEKGLPEYEKTQSFIPWQPYQYQQIALEKQQEWVTKGDYTKRKGLALLLGRVYGGPYDGKWLVGIDADNQTAINLVLEIFGCESLEELASKKGVVIEQHLEKKFDIDKNDWIEYQPPKAHFYFYSDVPWHNLPSIKTRKSKDAHILTLIEMDKFPSLELKCLNGGVHFAAPSLHVSSYRYKQIPGSPPVPTHCLSELESADIISKLESILNHYGDSYLDYRSADGKMGVVPIADMWNVDYIVTAGNNRHLDCRRIGASQLIKSQMTNKEQSLADTLVWNQVHCKPPLEEDDVKSGFYKYSIPFAEKKLQERVKAVEDAEFEKISIKPTDKEIEQLSERIEQKTEELEKQEDLKYWLLSTPQLKNYNGDFFEYLIDMASRTVKQENTLLRQIYYTFLSAWASRLANNLSIRAPSSEGKSYPILEAKHVSGEDDQHIIVINHITPKALIYKSGGYLVDKDGKPIKDEVKRLKKEIGKARRNKNVEELEDLKEQLSDLMADSAYVLELSDKCFTLTEPPRPELWDLLKAILSHDKFETKHLMTDKGNMGMETKTVILKGFPAFVFCSARDESKWDVWDEVQTRFMFASPNMIAQKYRDGNIIVGQKFGLPNYAKVKKLYSPEELRIAHRCYRFLKLQIKTYNSNPDSSPVWIPYQAQLAQILPAGKGADNRVAARLFQLLNIITLTKAHLRDKITFPTGETCVIANLHDLQEALHITQNVSGLPPHKLRFYSEVVCPLHEKRQKEVLALPKNLRYTAPITDDGKVWLTSREITDYYNERFGKDAGGKIYTIDNISKTFLDELHNHNYLEKIQIPDYNKTAYFYYPLVEVEPVPVVVTAADSNAKMVEPSNSTNLSKFDDKLHFERLVLPENCKEIPYNWLELQFMDDFDCRIDTEDIKISDKNGTRVPIKEWISNYESSQNLKLVHFFKTKQSQFDVSKTPISANPTPSNGKAHVKVVTESIEVSEKSSNLGKFDKFDDSNENGDNPAPGAGGGSSGSSSSMSSTAVDTTTTTTATTKTTNRRYLPTYPAQQRQLLLVEEYDLKMKEQAKVSNEEKTLQLLNEQRKKIPPELQQLYESSVSLDPEWIDEREQGGIRRIYAMSFVDWIGKKKVFHIDDYEHLDGSLFERTRTMLNDIFTYWFDNYRMSFGFNSLGEGSDREVIFENAQHYNTIIQPVEEQVVGSGKNRRVYYKFKERELKHTHIDWFRIFKNKAVLTYVFNNRYREFGLAKISKALFGVTKYKEADGLRASQEMPTEEQKMYVLQDSRLLSLLSTAENGNLFGAMQYISELLELPLQKVCHSQVSQWWATIYEKMGYPPPPLVEKVNPETGELEKVAPNYFYLTKTTIPTRGKNKGVQKVKVVSYKGGRVLDPTPGYYIDAIGLDQESQYPTVSIILNAGFETMCTCPTGECETDPTCQIRDTGDPEIDAAGWYICNHVGDSAYKQKLLVFREARIRAKENGERVKDLALKVIINAAYGVWGYKKFPYADTRIASAVTMMGRKMHRAMEELAKKTLYKFKIIGGDTDSILIEYPKDRENYGSVISGEMLVRNFCANFKAKHGIVVKPSKTMWSKIVITKKKHYIYWEKGNESNPIVKGMEAAKNNVPKLTNIIFDQFIKNIGADRDFVPDLRRAWTEEYQYCKKHRPDLLLVEIKLGKNPEEYKGNNLQKRLGLHQGKHKDETISYYEIKKGAEQEYGLDAYTNPECIDDEKYKEKFFISPFEDILKQLDYDVREVFN